MAAPIIWVDDTLQIHVSDREDKGIVTLVHAACAPSLSIRGELAADNPSGPARRLADLTAIRNLARRLLVACETAMADDRDAQVTP